MDDSSKVFETAAPPETRWRNTVKTIFWRFLPTGIYQRLLARSKMRDFRSGRFREAELDIVPALVKPGEVAVDVGANHGMWTLQLSKAVGSDGAVFAFEPVPFTFGVLRAVVRANRLDNVDLFNKGCSDESGKVEMAVPIQPSGSSDDLAAHLAARDANGHGENSAPTRIVACEMTTIDATLGDAVGVALIKVDIEGAELMALRGAARLIAQERPAIICEINPDFLAGFQAQPADVVEYLRQWGYSPFRYVEGRVEAVADIGAIEHSNILFLTDTNRLTEPAQL